MENKENGGIRPAEYEYNGKKIPRYGAGALRRGIKFTTTFYLIIILPLQSILSIFAEVISYLTGIIYTLRHKY